MDRLTTEDLQRLLHYENDVCVSIFIPTVRHNGGDTSQDKLRLKNLIEIAENEATNLERRSRRLHRAFQTAREVIAGDELWHGRGDGLAIFFSFDFVRILRLPISFRETVRVNRHFFVSPLLQLTPDHPVFILAISQKKTQLYYATRQYIEPREVPNLPANIEVATWYKEEEKQQLRRNRFGGSFHGQGDENHSDNSNLRVYLNMIDKAVNDSLNGNSIPMLLAAAEPVAGIYRQINSRRELASEVIAGNPDALTPQQLHELALSFISRQAKTQVQRAASQYGMFAAHQPERTSLEPTEVLKASRQGRVDTLLFHPKGVTVTGFGEQLTSATGSVYDDLVDEAIRQTLLHGGTVLPSAPSDTPNGAPVAAIMRY